MARREDYIAIENTTFIFRTNFSGDPERDTYGSSERKANIIIPSKEQADELASKGFNVKATTPKNEGDEPTYFVVIRVNYDSEWPPKIYLVSGDTEPRMLDVESIDILDKIYVTNVNAVLSPYLNPRTNRKSLYVRTMYVEQDIDEDPFASRYRARHVEEDEVPFA